MKHSFDAVFAYFLHVARNPKWMRYFWPVAEPVTSKYRKASKWSRWLGDNQALSSCSPRASGRSSCRVHLKNLRRAQRRRIPSAARRNKGRSYPPGSSEQHHSPLSSYLSSYGSIAPT